MAKILVVDDEPDIVSMMTMRLEAMGHTIVSALDGQEGYELAKSSSPELIILDVMLPKMDGYKVCGLLKSDTRFRAIPIIMFTARAQEEDRLMSEDAGADAYLNKPLNSEELKAALTKLLPSSGV